METALKLGVRETMRIIEGSKLLKGIVIIQILAIVIAILVPALIQAEHVSKIDDSNAKSLR